MQHLAPLLPLCRIEDTPVASKEALLIQLSLLLDKVIRDAMEAYNTVAFFRLYIMLETVLLPE